MSDGQGPGWWHPPMCIDQHDDDHNCLDEQGSIIGWREPHEVGQTHSQVHVVESGPGYEAADDIAVFSDPNVAETYRAAQERFGWAIVHDLIVDAESVGSAVGSAVPDAETSND